MAKLLPRLSALRVQSPRRLSQGTSTTKKKIWNSSVTIDKTVSHTANEKMKNNPVRKVLNFQPKPRALPNNRATMFSESPKLSKPEARPKKSQVMLQARNNVTISSINHLSATPVVNKLLKCRMTLGNKENVPNHPVNRKLPPPKQLIKKKVILGVTDTSLSNESWKSSCDASFLQKEKEINDVEEKTTARGERREEQTLENIAEVTPPVSTSFQEYRNVKEFFNNSSELESSALYHDNIIVCFDKQSENKENNKREESVIVSLCDLLNKPSVSTSTGPISTELEDLLQIKKQTEHNLLMIDNSIAALNKIKESQLTSLMYVRKLINDKNQNETADKTITNTKEIPKMIENKDTLKVLNHQESPRIPIVIKLENLSPER